MVYTNENWFVISWVVYILGTKLPKYVTLVRQKPIIAHNSEQHQCATVSPLGWHTSLNMLEENTKPMYSDVAPTNYFFLAIKHSSF